MPEPNADLRELMAAIQLLGAQHQREGFDCGDAALNEFLQRQAGQQQGQGVLPAAGVHHLRG